GDQCVVAHSSGERGHIFFSFSFQHLCRTQVLLVSCVSPSVPFRATAHLLNHVAISRDCVSSCIFTGNRLAFADVSSPMNCGRFTFASTECSVSHFCIVDECLHRISTQMLLICVCSNKFCR
ncbi:unnamed protein product, partial [Pylaiella littoralis]